MPTEKRTLPVDPIPRKEIDVVADMDPIDQFLKVLDPDFWESARQGQIKSQKSKGPYKTFDWAKAAKIIKETGVAIAYGGLKEDWKYTGGRIFDDGKPTKKTTQYMGSQWATPVLRIKDQVIDCYVEVTDKKQNLNTWWPPEILAEFNM